MRKSEMRELVEEKVLLTGPIRARGMADRAGSPRSCATAATRAPSSAEARAAAARAGRRRNVRESACEADFAVRWGAYRARRVMSSSAREQ